MSPPSNSFEFTNGKRGKDNVIYDGQRYTLNRRRHGTDGVEKSYWSALLVAVKLDLFSTIREWKTALYSLHNHVDQQAELTVHRPKVQLKSRAATSNISTKRIVAQTVSGLDYESRTKLGCQLNCLGNIAQSSRIAANSETVMSSVIK